MNSPETKPPFWFFFCNHWTQGGIGYSFPMGWHEGRRYERTFSTVYTIEKMLDAAEEWPGLVSTLELDAFAYTEIAEEAPETLARLKRAIVEGKAGIEGGTYGQPLGQDFGAESNLRQLVFGRSTILETVDYPVHTFLVEEQWFHPQLPQLLRQSGYRYAALQAQNSGQVMPMHADVVGWQGADGTVIPTIPSNDMQISCVRQYLDYDAYKPILARYRDPLLFQWIEVWVPGMDWGASAAPFDKALHDVFASGGQPTTLQDYFEAILPGRDLETVFIPLDSSNYANNWYQAGGWGYDGDRVIQLDAVAEHGLLALEALAAIAGGVPTAAGELPLDGLWKRLMVLQNHDFSCARNYQVWTKDGQLTENGYLAQAGYRRLIADTDAMTEAVAGEADAGGPAFFNPVDHGGIRVFDAPDGTGGRELVEVDLPALGWTRAGEARQVEAEIIEAGASIGDERFDIRWLPGSWTVAIVDRLQGIEIEAAGFSGRIGKLNEHDGGQWPALSPGHALFSFAFDGTVHAPDQVAAGRVTARVLRRGDLRSTLKLECDLLTLHTSPTPVCRAEMEVHLDHRAGTVTVDSFLYCGVWLSLESCRAVFRHRLASARYFRDYAFGEEEAKIEAVYPLSYTRIEGDGPKGPAGVQIVHGGSRRAFYKREEAGGNVEYLLARSKLRGEYRFGFTLVFDRADAALAARRARFLANPPVSIPASGALATYLPAGKPAFAFSDPAIEITALASTGDGLMGMSEALVADQGGERSILDGDTRLVLRAVNRSERSVEARLIAALPIAEAAEILPTGALVRQLDPAADFGFPPYAVRSFALRRA